MVEFLVAQRFQRVEGKLAISAELLVRQLADVGDDAATGPRGEVTVHNPAAARIEYHRNDAVEGAGRGNVAELHLLDEGRGVDAGDPEGQALLAGLAEVEDCLLERQLASGERPAARFDAHLETGKQLITDLPVEDVDAGLDLIDGCALARARSRAPANR